MLFTPRSNESYFLAIGFISRSRSLVILFSFSPTFVHLRLCLQEEQ